MPPETPQRFRAHGAPTGIFEGCPIVRSICAPQAIRITTPSRMMALVLSRYWLISSSTSWSYLSSLFLELLSTKLFFLNPERNVRFDNEHINRAAYGFSAWLKADRINRSSNCI